MPKNASNARFGQVLSEIWPPEVFGSKNSYGRAQTGPIRAQTGPIHAQTSPGHAQMGPICMQTQAGRAQTGPSRA